jgi:hypothetical protein
MLLIADPLDGYQSAALQPGQFSLDCPRSRADASNNFRGVEGAVWVAKDEGQHTLLHLGE